MDLGLEVLGRDRHGKTIALKRWSSMWRSEWSKDYVCNWRQTPGCPFRPYLHLVLKMNWTEKYRRWKRVVYDN